MAVGALRPSIFFGQGMRPSVTSFRAPRISAWGFCIAGSRAFAFAAAICLGILRKILRRASAAA
jgi:hypothetical protein